MDKPIMTETGGKALSLKAGKIISDSIRTAEIVYKDDSDQVVFTEYLGRVSPGYTINVKVPEAGDFTLIGLSGT